MRWLPAKCSPSLRIVNKFHHSSRPARSVVTPALARLTLHGIGNGPGPMTWLKGADSGRKAASSTKVTKAVDTAGRAFDEARSMARLKTCFGECHKHMGFCFRRRVCGDVR